MARCPYCRKSGHETRLLRAASWAGDEENPECLCLGCRKVLEIEREIKESLLALNKLIAKREMLVSSRNEYHDPFASRLPVEIVCQIFLNCQPNRPNDSSPHETYVEKPFIYSVLLPGRVCRHWRAISRRAPELWTTLCHSVTKTNCEASISFLQEWLQRSGELPLYIQLRLGGCPLENSNAHKVLSIITQQSWRLQVLDIALPTTHLGWMSRLLSKHNFHRLAHFKYQLSDLFNSDHVTESLHLNASPQLLTCRTTFHDHLSFGHDHLTHFFGYHGMHIHNYFVLLKSASRLTFCSMFEAYGKLPPGASAICPSLETLHVIHVTANYWNRFSFPNLMVLRVHGDHRAWKSLRHLVSNSKLREFTIDSGEERQQEIARLLKSTPDLERLSIGGETLNDPLFVLLDRYASSSTYLGSLKMLECRRYGDALNWTALLAFLTTMSCRNGSSFHHFRIMHGDVNEHSLSTGMDQANITLLLQIVPELEFEFIDDQGRDLIRRMSLGSPV